MTTQQQREFNSRLAILSGRAEHISNEVGDRQVGKTYRSILRCLIWASENPGKNVLYACYEHVNARHAFRMACDMTSVLNNRKVEPQSMKIIFPNNSTLSFVYPGNDKLVTGASIIGVARDVD